MCAWTSVSGKKSGSEGEEAAGTGTGREGSTSKRPSHHLSGPREEMKLKQGYWQAGCSSSLTCFLHVIGERELPQMARFSFSVRQRKWPQCWAQKTRASWVNSTPPEFVPQQGVLSRKPSICFPLLEELLTMSSFLFKHRCVAVAEVDWVMRNVTRKTRGRFKCRQLGQALF